MFAINALLFMIASEAALSALDVGDFASSGGKPLHCMRTAAAGAIMTVVGCIFLLMVRARVCVCGGGVRACVCVVGGGCVCFGVVGGVPASVATAPRAGAQHRARASHHRLSRPIQTTKRNTCKTTNKQQNQTIGTDWEGRDLHGGKHGAGAAPAGARREELPVAHHAPVAGTAAAPGPVTYTGATA